MGAHPEDQTETNTVADNNNNTNSNSNPTVTSVTAPPTTTATNNNTNNNNNNNTATPMVEGNNPVPPPPGAVPVKSQFIEEGDEIKVDECATVVISDYESKPSKFYSDSFKIDGNTWRLLIFPKGNNNQNINNVSIFLDCSDIRDHPTGFRKLVVFCIALKSHADNSYYLKESKHVFHIGEQDWGYSNYISQAELFDKDKKYLNNHELTFVVNVKVVKDYETIWNETWASWNSKKETGCVGLKNQGATCYMNSLLQTLFFTKQFRKAVFSLDTSEDDPIKSVPLALQRVFFQLQTADNPVSTTELTKSFGWDAYDSFMQHDVQEFSRVLIDNVETKMKGTSVEKIISILFEGKMKSYVRCINVDFESSRVESYYDIQLNVKGMKDVYASFEDYVQVETLNGENKYMAEGHGLQDAKKGVTFVSFPPVLHLQLKRFEYDMRKDAMVKINDRFEFPEKLDLDRFLVEPEATPAHYSLYAVLVHSGDVNGGHYVAFLRTEKDGKWFKFDDDRVSPATSEEALDDNFGSSEALPLNQLGPRGPMSRNGMMRLAKRFTNAYMLVYIRDSCVDEVMKPVEEIPNHLLTRFQDEKRHLEEERKRKEEEHLFTTIKIASAESLSIHSDLDLVDWNSPKILSVRVQKTAPFQEIKQQVLDSLNISIDHQRFWSVVTRENKTIRVDTVLDTSANKTVVDVLPDVLRGNKAKMFVEEAEHPEQPIDPKAILLFIKFYDPKEVTMHHLTHFLVDYTTKIGELTPLVLRAANLPLDTPLLACEEVKPGYIEASVPTKTLRQSELQNGDILCFQVALPAEESKNLEYPTISSYFSFLANRSNVEFRELDKPTVPGFKLELSKLISYEDVAAIIGEKLQMDPLFIRFTAARPGPAPNEFVPQAKPLRRHEVSTLNTMLQYQVNSYPPTHRHAPVIFYERLSMSIVELESRLTVKMVYLNSKIQKEKEFSIMLPKNSTVGEAIQESLKQIQPPVGGSGTYRLMTLSSHNISKVYAPNDIITSQMADYSVFYLEELPQEQVEIGPEDQLVQVKHFHIEVFHTHGIPFFFVIHKGDTVGAVRKRIQAKLDINDKDFTKYGLFILQYSKKVELTNDDELFPRLEPTDYIGLHHIDKTPKTTSRFDRAIKIHN